MENKAQGLSLNVVIIAAVVLVVLIVLWSIFTGRMGGFSEELDTCKGTCEVLSVCEDNGAVVPGYCPEEIEKIGSTGTRASILGEKVCCVMLK